jgi:integrase/recombinase XerC
VYLFHIQAWCRWKFTMGLVDQDPSVGLPRIRVPKPPPRPVTTAALGQIMRRAVAPYRTYFGLAAYAGLRCLEIVTLDREDVTEESMWIRGKGDKVREVPTHPVVWHLVEPLPLGRIFHLPGYEPHVAAHKLSMYGSRQLTRLGFRDVTMHMLRHWCGSETYRRSRNLRATQEILGHASIAHDGAVHPGEQRGASTSRPHAPRRRVALCRTHAHTECTPASGHGRTRGASLWDD